MSRTHGSPEIPTGVSSEMRQPLPGSCKVYVSGSRPDIRVPMREIRLQPTRRSNGTFEDNGTLWVYDTSGPYTDPNVEINLTQGLPPIREKWIQERGDTVVLDGPTSAYAKARLDDPTLARVRFPNSRRPRRAQEGRRVTQMHYAKRGIITPEMEFAAIRENEELARARKHISEMAKRGEFFHPVEILGESAGTRDHSRVCSIRISARACDPASQH